MDRTGKTRDSESPALGRSPGTTGGMNDDSAIPGFKTKQGKGDVGYESPSKKPQVTKQSETINVNDVADRARRLPTLASEVNVRFIRMNRFCMGIKRGNRYVCGESADSESINKAMDLLIEAVNRVLHWRVWDAWWLDYWRGEWLRLRVNAEVVLRRKYGDDVVDAVLKLIDKYINYIKSLRDYWIRSGIGSEVRRIFDDLRSGRAEVVIWNNGSGFSVYGGRLTLSVHKTNSGVLVHLELKGLEGVVIDAPDIFRRVMGEDGYGRFIEELIGLRGGFAITDEYVKDGKPAMDTTQPWQVLLWSLLYHGRVYVRIGEVNVNEGSVTMSWRLIANNHNSLRGAITKNAEKLSDRAIHALMFTVVLGDGSAFIKEITSSTCTRLSPTIKIAMSNSKFEALEPILNRLSEMIGWSSYFDRDGNVVRIVFNDDHAINLTRAMINALPLILRDFLDALEFSKWLRLRRIAEIETKPGMSGLSVIAAGYRFTVHVKGGTVELRRVVSNWARVNEAFNSLREEYGEDFITHIRINKDGRKLTVVIPIHVFERYGDIKEQVIKVLCRKYEAVNNEKRQEITKALRRLAPTKGAAA